MKTVCIRPVPFCYGPSAIAIAVARQLKAIEGVRLVAIGDTPSLDLLESENRVFDAVIHGTDASSCVRSAQAESTSLFISICDFEFAEAVRRKAPAQHLVFIDPLLWMWHEPPEALGKCDLYCALEFPGVRRLACECGFDERHFAVVPQVAEWKGKRLPKTDSGRRVVVNLGGMQSPFGCNMPLAAAMCEEIAFAVAAITEISSVCVCTGIAIAEKLRESSVYWPPIEITSLCKVAFDESLAACDCLLTVPGMSIVFESCLANAPTFFLLPLNYSQHLQLAHYREMFLKLQGVFLADLGEYEELKPGMPEAHGVEAAAAIGERFARDIEARMHFRSAIRSYLSSLNGAAPLILQREQRLDGAAVIVQEIQNRGLI